MSIKQITNKLKKKYLYKQVLRFYPISEEISRSTLSEYYLKWRDENKVPYWCDNSRCILHEEHPRWNGKKITLTINNIDSNNRNWRPNNLRLICPNCYSQKKSEKVC